MTESINGAAYRVKAKHPRRDMPLRVTTKDGTLIAVSGQTCEGLSPAIVASMLANGFLEPIPGASERAADAKDRQTFPARRIKGKV